jgi:hypothetical protein
MRRRSRMKSLRIYPGRPEVLVLRLQPFPQRRLLGVPLFRFRCLGQHQEVSCMPFPQGLHGAVLLEAPSAYSRIVSSIMKRGSPSGTSS